MDYTNILDKTDAYIKSIVNSKEFEMLLDLKNKIESDLKDLVDNFKVCEEKYNEALKYGKYHPDLKKYQQMLSDAKANLYSNEVVKKYFALQNDIQKEIDDFINDLTSSISNKFKKIQSLNL